MAKSQTSTSIQPKTNRSNGHQSGSTKAMASKAKSETSLLHMFENGLRDIYNAEQQLLKALPEMVKAAESEDLQEAFSNHLEQTKKHAERLEKIFSKLGVEKEGETCEAMEGLITEAKEVISNYEENAVRDSALIIAAQKVEHYEIATYGSLCELAEVLGYHQIADVLDRTLEEEEKADHLLTGIAKDVNDEAFELGGNREEKKY